jgi:hypothetical protein
MFGTICETGTAESRGLLPFEVIELAIAGNPEAMDLVLQHYDQQIDYLSSRKFYDDDGNHYYGTDLEIKDRLKSRLIQAVLRFKIYM